MKCLVIGSGGREHALVWKIAQSRLIEKIYCAPGNPGIANLAENIPIAASDSAKLLEFALANHIDLTVVGPEDPLVAGIVDLFAAHGLKIFGPSKQAARLEGSKVFAKELLQKYNIPTAGYAAFHTLEEAKSYITDQTDFPLVLKANGLAAGKGVLICKDRQEAMQGISVLMEKKVFGAAGDQVVIEEFLEGEEVSVFVLSDGNAYKILSPSQDHKKAFDNDLGKNTGGMGAYAPTPLVDQNLHEKIDKNFIKPTLTAMVREGCMYKGLLYLGLIVTENGPKVLEYNCRFGDPETEIVLPLLESDLVPLLLSCIDGTIDQHSIQIKPGYAVDVVLASGGYPDGYHKGMPISGLDDLEATILIFHAGTSAKEGKACYKRGRVLNVVAVAPDFESARNQAYKAVNKIHFDKMHYRKDIGSRAIKYMAY